jgi:phosphatidylglycerol:prolipoprotein diacylglycerol transferase
MYPYINIGSLHLGTFGLLLWLAAVCGTFVLHRNFQRFHVEADALNIVALTTLAGILGAKLWHELQNPGAIMPGIHIEITEAGSTFFGILHWFQTGFAWFGGLLAGIATLMWQGRQARFRGLSKGTLGERVGALRMLDLAAPAAAIGYGVGRIGCLTSGDGDYGINTTLPWGVHMMFGADQYHRALVLPSPPTALVQPTPIYELIYAVLIMWVLWTLAKKYKPVAWLTGLYLVLSGLGRFLVEFVRINPKLYFHHTMSNAQVAALGSLLVGVGVMAWAIKADRPWAPKIADDPRT